eukprot:TRINITY_DN11103_c0_g1_i3.p1 TRINITY_DN11103_c0_g1~~TRINITY_DN11103_c0_g1_i3.p1  ORF type:complete len:385 (-),score=104.36 TRINITY_DN11103_c0_g1_i3:169-1323(-)
MSDSAERKILKSYGCDSYEGLIKKMTNYAQKNNFESTGFPFTPELLKTIGVSHPVVENTMKMLQAGEDWRKRLDQVTADLRKLDEAPKTLEEPDLTPIKDPYESYILNRLYDIGVDVPGSRFNPLGHGYFDEFFNSMFFGNYDDFKEIVDSMSRKDLAVALKTRVGYFQVTPIFVPLMGLRTALTLEHESYKKQAVEVKRMYPKRKGEFLKIFDALMSFGSQLEVKDRTGKTPLFYTLLAASEPAFVIASRLLEAGVDPDPRDIFGFYPLGCAIEKNCLAMVALLVKFNVDPNLKNMYTDVPIRTMIEYAAQKPDVKLLKLLLEAPRKSHGKKSGLCFVCPDPTAGKKCSSCRLAWYCSPQCQKGDWTKHKEVCHIITKMSKKK